MTYKGVNARKGATLRVSPAFRGGMSMEKNQYEMVVVTLTTAWKRKPKG